MVTSLLTLMAVARIWARAFWRRIDLDIQADQRLPFQQLIVVAKCSGQFAHQHNGRNVPAAQHLADTLECAAIYLNGAGQVEISSGECSLHDIRHGREQTLAPFLAA